MQYLTSPELISLTGSVIAFIGTVIMAFSLGGVFWELKFGLEALSSTIESITSGGDIFVFRGLEERVQRALKKARPLTFVGLFFITTSIILQSISLYFNNLKTEETTTKVVQIQKLTEKNNYEIEQNVKTMTSNLTLIVEKYNVLNEKQSELETQLLESKNKITDLETTAEKLKSNLKKAQADIEASHNKSLNRIGAKDAPPG